MWSNGQRVQQEAVALQIGTRVECHTNPDWRVRDKVIVLVHTTSLLQAQVTRLICCWSGASAMTFTHVIILGSFGVED